MGTKKAAENAAHQTNILNNISMFPASMKKLNQWVLSCNKIPLNLFGYFTDPTKGFSYSEVTTAYNPTVHFVWVL